MLTASSSERDSAPMSVPMGDNRPRRNPVCQSISRQHLKDLFALPSASIIPIYPAFVFNAWASIVLSWRCPLVTITIYPSSSMASSGKPVERLQEGDFGRRWEPLAVRIFGAIVENYRFKTDHFAQRRNILRYMSGAERYRPVPEFRSGSTRYFRLPSSSEWIDVQAGPELDTKMSFDNNLISPSNLPTTAPSLFIRYCWASGSCPSHRLVISQPFPFVSNIHHCLFVYDRLISSLPLDRINQVIPAMTAADHVHA